MAFSSGGFTRAGVVLASSIMGKAASAPTNYYLALGTGTTAFVNTQTTLVTEITASDGLQRAVATLTYPATGNYAGDAWTLSKTFTYTGSATVVVSEIGSLDAASTGNLIVRGVISPTRTMAVSGDAYMVNLKHVLVAG